MLARVVALLCLLVALAAPATAMGQASPFSGLPPAQQETATVPTVSNSSTNANDDPGLSGTAKAGIVGIGAILLLGIAYLIVKDARERAPVAEPERGPHGTRSPHRHARARAKAKAARAQRKRNRAKR